MVHSSVSSQTVILSTRQWKSESSHDLRLRRLRQLFCGECFVCARYQRGWRIVDKALFCFVIPRLGFNLSLAEVAILRRMLSLQRQLCLLISVSDCYQQAGPTQQTLHPFGARLSFQLIKSGPFPGDSHNQPPADIGSATICLSITTVCAFMGGVSFGRRGFAWGLISAQVPAALCSVDVVASVHASASRALPQVAILCAASPCVTVGLLGTCGVGGISLGCYSMSLLVSSVNASRPGIGMVLAIDD